jgi:5S rRNA maturation endonuclease (ribonuclease M5)
MIINYEALKRHLEKLQNASNSAIIIVEGKRDVAALKPLLKANFFVINKGIKRSLYETAEHIASKYRSAILLLDADKKGKELKRKMRSYLSLHGVRVHVEQKLLKLAHVRNVEDLCSAVAVSQRVRNL